MNVLRLTDWQTPATAYPNVAVGCARLGFTRYSKGVYDCYGVGGYQYFECLRPIKVKTLKIRRKVTMVDDAPHFLAMREHAACYHGHVVVAGLGLGLIVHALQDNPRVSRITVVEIEQDVIDMVGPLLKPDKLEIVHGDFRDWDSAADGIFYDLFVGNGYELRHDAWMVFLRLCTQFQQADTIRIHGFDNDALAMARKRLFQR